jgi:hypothetical protein
MNARLIAAVLVLALIGAAYIAGRWDGGRIKAGERAIAEVAAEKAAKASREESARAIARISVRHQTIHNALEREVIREPIYTDSACSITDHGLRLINQAITGQEPSPRSLPASSPP